MSAIGRPWLCKNMPISSARLNASTSSCTRSISTAVPKGTCFNSAILPDAVSRRPETCVSSRRFFHQKGNTGRAQGQNVELLLKMFLQIRAKCNACKRGLSRSHFVLEAIANVVGIEFRHRWRHSAVSGDRHSGSLWAEHATRPRVPWSARQGRVPSDATTLSRCRQHEAHCDVRDRAAL